MGAAHLRSTAAEALGDQGTLPARGKAAASTKQFNTNDPMGAPPDRDPPSGRTSSCR